MSLRRKIKKTYDHDAMVLDTKKHQSAIIELTLNWDPLKPITLDFYNKYHPEAWGVVANQLGIYQIITEDLVSFIGHLIKNKKAIEICCGVGTLGRCLNIPLIDRKIQQESMAKQFYENIEKIGTNARIYYPDDIIEITANKAFKEMQPDWVIGAYVTPKYNKKMGSIYGPVEEEFVTNANYVHIGNSNLKIHSNKSICKIPHYTIEADWIINRGSYRSPSHMKIWTKEELDFDAFPEHLEFDYITP